MESLGPRFGVVGIVENGCVEIDCILGMKMDIIIFVENR